MWKGTALGMPSLLEVEDLAALAGLCGELGLDFVELNANLPAWADPSGVSRAALRRAKRDNGIAFTLHLDERMDVCDFNPLVAQAHRETVRRALELAAEAEMPILNLHMNPGVYFTLPQGRVYLYEREGKRYEDCLCALRDLVEREAPDGLTVCVENTGGFRPFEREGVELLLQSRRFGLTLDVGHWHATGGADRALYEAHAGRVAHMHLHDALGRRDHLPLGQGEADISAALTLARSCGCRALIEVKTAEALRASVAALRSEALTR